MKDIFGPQINTSKRIQHASVSTDRPFMLKSNAIRTDRVLNVVCTFLYECVAPLQIPTHTSTDNENRFISKLFTTFCIQFYANQPTAASYHPRTTVQLERYNKTAVSHLYHYVTNHRRNSNIYLFNRQAMRAAYTYTNQPTPLLLVFLFLQLPGTAIFDEDFTFFSCAQYTTEHEALRAPLLRRIIAILG